MLYK